MAYITDPIYDNPIRIRCHGDDEAKVAAEGKKICQSNRLSCDLSAAVLRWGFKDIWLHTEVSNVAAVELYQSEGFKEFKRDPPFFGPFRRILFCKQLKSSAGIQQKVESTVSGSSRNSTYVWDVKSKKTQ